MTFSGGPSRGRGLAAPRPPGGDAAAGGPARPVTSRSNREQAHVVLLSRRLAGESGTSPAGPTRASAGPQLKVPGSTTTGDEPGIVIAPPPSPQQGAGAAPEGPQAGPQAGSCIGSPQAGWQGCAGLPQGAAAAPPRQAPPLRAQGERNSMNEGRRQLLPPPKQLEQPGAAARLATAIARHNVRLMIRDLHHRRTAARRRNARASSATTPPNPSSRSAARTAERSEKSPSARGRLRRPCR